MLRNLTCPAPCAPVQKKCLPSIDPKKQLTVLLEPDFPTNATNWNKGICAPCKGVYTWISSPKAMYNNRKMVKNAPPTPPGPQNIMYDKRIVRGSNFSQNQISIGDGDCCTKENEARRRAAVRRRCMARNQRGIIGTPPPVKGRKHETIQTEKYLEELFARPPEYDAQCQTDLFLHRPPSPPYIPSKTGVDVQTEICDGELFDFDTEVQPILETIVGRSAEQAILEVMHEEELSDMRQQQQELLAIREIELAELRRLEAEEIRLQAEKERRNRQEQIARSLDKEMMERVTAAKLIQGHIADKMPGILATLEPYVEAEKKDDLERVIGPWLAKEVAEEVGQIIDSRDLLEEIVREVIEDRAARYAELASKESIDFDVNSMLLEETPHAGEEEEEQEIEMEVNEDDVDNKV